MTEKLPIESGCADYVICQEGIEHLSDQLLAMREFNRILKPEGRLVITTPNISHLRARLSHFLVESHLYNCLPPSEVDAIWFSGSGEKELYFGHVFLIGAQRLRILAKLAGFRIAKIHPVRISWGSVFVGVLYPLLLLVNLFAYVRSVMRHKEAEPAWKRSVYWEIFKLNVNPTIQFGKHVFVEFEKEAELSEVASGFYKKLGTAG